jgi:hypothetical protein
MINKYIKIRRESDGGVALLESGSELVLRRLPLEHDVGLVSGILLVLLLLLLLLLVLLVEVGLLLALLRVLRRRQPHPLCRVVVVVAALNTPQQNIS